MASPVALLRQHPLWAPLSEPAARQLAASAGLSTYSAGQVIVRDGEAAGHVHYLTHGLVRVYFPRTRTRASLTLALIEAPGMFGDIACLNQSPYTATVEALAACGTVSVPRAAWRAAIEREPLVAMLHYQKLAQRFAGATHIQRWSIDPRPVERVAALLLSYAQHVGVAVEGGTLIDAVIAQEDIAEQTASTRRTVVRALGELFDSGALLRSGRKLVVVDAAKLARAALAS
jgi:CRP/FNR family transcriptional regulator